MDNRISIVYHMAYPGPRNTNSVLRGEPDENYLMTTLKKILEDNYFGGIEVTALKDPVLKVKVAELLKASGKEVIYSAQPVQLSWKDDMIPPTDISSINEEDRKRAVHRLFEHIDDAYAFGARQFAFVSGRDVGTSAGLKLRKQAKMSLIRSIIELHKYSTQKAKELGVEPLVLTLEMFDRLDEKGCKNQLIGPTTEAIELAEELRYTYGCEDFGLMYDLSHMPLLKDNSFDGETPGVLRTLAPYLNHVHVGNCVLVKDDPLYGDTHVGFDYPNGAVSKDLLAEFLTVLNEINYQKGIGFEVAPHGDEQSDTLVSITKAYFDEARNRIDVNYALGSYVYVPRRFLPEHIFDMITDIRVNKPNVIIDEARSRKQRDKLTKDGKLLLLACDHPARHVTNVGSDPVRMGDRLDYLSRIMRVMSSELVDGVMTTPDIMEDLFILNYMMKEKGKKSFLDGKVLVGCMNRAGLAGYSFEMDDRMTAYTPETMHDMKLDGAKMMFRLEPNEKYSGRTMVYCAEAITKCNKYNLTVFLEALPVQKTDKGYPVKMDADEMIKVIGVASAIGDSSRNIWLKIPYVEGYDRVVRATTLPILMLGGESTGRPIDTIQQFEKGLGAGKNVRGAMVGRNVLYPGNDDPRAIAEAISLLIHQNYSTEEAVRYIRKNRGIDMDYLK
ncbi:Fructose-bisphosphate aldolase class Ia, DhnA family [Caldanaerobius fijiensis DSM 17918]|uniref:Fructose-bisphosphate aldolase class Ia, DhnA family n=1 Tax=Caldanaerobius fijiensis DSM 17918 TaxID=1121256 RepID=A0A1M5CVT2_9THEO|nr:TIM barrel protein [Caldanaerobius fijiensis]SHF58717.1 Fructose-bisphosphate aldolase class Ia, DhnA family [Caldanaerobius fijiensis DSM 17918]